MRMLLLAVAVFAALALAPGAGGSSAGTSGTLRNLALPKPAWLTPDLEAHILASGTHGVEVPIGNAADPLNVNCLGYAPPYVSANGASITAVSAGTCMVSPHGCTMRTSARDLTRRPA